MNRIVRWLGVAFVAVLGWSAPAQHHALGGPEPIDIRTGVFRGQTVTYQVIDGLAVWEGDIILGTPEELEPAKGMVPLKGTYNRKEAHGTAQEDLLWPDGIVPYVIAAELPEPDRAIEAIQHWNENTVIQLVERSDEANYVRVVPAEGSVCASRLGMVGGAQEITLPDGCSPGSIIHEIGHAVGLYHEQQRDDRDDHVNILFENIDKRRASQYFQVDELGTDIGPYDYGSIMHYGAYGFVRNIDGPGIETIPPGLVIGQRDGLSGHDIDSVARLYGQPPTTTTIYTNPPGLEVIVDGISVTTPITYGWAVGTNHTIEAPSPQMLDDEDERFLFGVWSDEGQQEHVVAASASSTVFAAHFIQQFRIESGAEPPGSGTVTMNPSSPDRFYTARTSIEATATPAGGFSFGGWQGPALVFFHGTSGTPARFPALAPGLNYTGIFTQAPLTTIASNPPRRLVSVDGNTMRLPVNFVWEEGSVHTVAVEQPIQLGLSEVTRWTFEQWNDGGGVSHDITVPDEARSIVAEFAEQHLLTTFGRPPDDGEITRNPSSEDGFYDTGTSVQLTAEPAPGREFSVWFNEFLDLVSTDNPEQIWMGDQGWMGAFFVESRRLMSGVPLEFSFPAVDNPSIANGPFSFTVDVPPGATELDIRMQTDMTSTNLDLYVNHGSDIVLSNGRVVADYSSTGPGGIESIVITPDSSPPLMAGTYFIGFVIWTTGVPSSGTITASVEAPDVPVPEISISVPAFTFTAPEGMNPPPQSFDVRNSGDGTLNFEVAVDQPWLSVTPNQGSSAGEAVPIEINITSSSLDPGTFEGSVTVSETTTQAATLPARILQASPAIIPVTLVVNPAEPGPPGPQIASGGVVVGNLLPTINSISPNSIISIFGSDFAPEGFSDTDTQTDAGGLVATNQSGVCVEIGGIRAPMFHVFPGQLNVQAPSIEGASPLSVVVITGCDTPEEQRTAAESVPLVALTPAFFVTDFVDGGGANPIAALHQDGVGVVGDPGSRPGSTPAAPGEFISLFGTGFGATNPLLQAGAIPGGLADIAGEFTVTIGGVPVTGRSISYAGIAPCCAGLYQIVVEVPTDAVDGNLEVIAAVDGISTPSGPYITVKR